MSCSYPGTVKSVPTDEPIWDRFFTVAPLVLIGSKEVDGSYDLAPKHMAMPLGWQNFYCFVCTPRHRTYGNILRTREFTVSFPGPENILQSSLAAGPRFEGEYKPSLAALPTFPADKVDGILVDHCYLYLECTLHSMLDGFGANSLIIGRVIAAAVCEEALRGEERDDNDLLYQNPMLAYLNPGRLTVIRESQAFPFPKDFSR